MEDQSKLPNDIDSPKVEGVRERESPSPVQMRRELEEEFNVQRARMKDLFLQKEDDMRKMLQEKEQLESEVLGLRAELQQLQNLSENQTSEIQSLQLLVSETVEASSSGTEEVRRLKTKNLELEQQLGLLRQQQQQQEVSLAPATLVRSLARKLGADADLDQPAKRQIEDNELLQAIIQPLEMEISALKGKLRETDTQLQEALKSKSAVPAGAASVESASASGDTEPESEVGRRGRAPGQCDMCANYEKQLVAEQARADAARDRAAALARHLAQATEELEGMRSIHDETIRTWQAARAQDAQLLRELDAAVARAHGDVATRAAAADGAARRALHRVTLLTVDRETLQKRLDALERDNGMLMGRYVKKAEEMQNEIIDLPDNVEELQEHTLRLREQLIFCQLGREEAAAAEAELRAQLLEHGERAHRLEGELGARGAALAAAREQVDRLQTEHEQMSTLADKLRHSTDMIEQLLEDKKRLQAEVGEVRARVSVLQHELDTSERVQQDFVRLSQSLQVQLQRIREADSEVRWQHDDDVTQCPACHQHLPTSKKKVHCRHCGRIFCSACVAHSVPSGPRGTPARVCAVCRTLLQPHTAPYFSTDPPHSPD